MAVLIVVIVPMMAGDLRGQCPSFNAASRRATSFRIRWSAGSLLVTPDTTYGVSFWFETDVPRELDEGAPRQFDERFEPDSLLSWVILTRQLMDLKAPLPNDTSTIVTSGSMRGRNGGSMLVARIRSGQTLSNKLRLVMARPTFRARVLELNRTSMDTLLDVTEAAAKQSGYRTSHSAWVPPPIFSDMSLLPGRSMLHYPEELARHSIDGEVWARFCVGVDGRPDMATFWAPLSDHEGFERSVKQYLKSTRFMARDRDGTPIRYMIAERFVFAIK